MHEITIKLELRDVNWLLDMLGELPTKTNVWPLAHKIRGQAEQQLTEKVEDVSSD